MTSDEPELPPSSRYAAGQPLFVRVEGINGAADWLDANVVERLGGGWHKLLLYEDENSEGQLVELDLDPFNHGPREIPLRSFRELWVRHARAMRAQLDDF
jgi:hypothetical protein